ncbi:MAG: hypothetical protein A2X88_00910 [Deltaproteobacteria bacterium GWC2_65_14]|nr:MAG: hypothetical protein A2X88_00910 [Deltaproteobacteria bacterium GWC2_65_14]
MIRNTLRSPSWSSASPGWQSRDSMATFSAPLRAHIMSSTLPFRNSPFRTPSRTSARMASWSLR